MFVFQCFRSSWYLSVDMQLFIIAPAIAYLIHRWRAKALIALFVLILSCVGCTLATHAIHNLGNSYAFLHLTYSRIQEH